MEITELVRTAIIEDVKGKTSDFIGKEEYKVSATLSLGMSCKSSEYILIFCFMLKIFVLRLFALSLGRGHFEGVGLTHQG